MWEELVTMWGELRRSGDSLSLSEFSLQSQWLLLRFVLAGIASVTIAVTIAASRASRSLRPSICGEEVKMAAAGKAIVRAFFGMCVWCFLCVDVCVPGCSMFLMNGR